MISQFNKSNKLSKFARNRKISNKRITRNTLFGGAHGQQPGLFSRLRAAVSRSSPSRVVTQPGINRLILNSNNNINKHESEQNKLTIEQQTRTIHDLELKIRDFEYNIEKSKRQIEDTKILIQSETMRFADIKEEVVSLQTEIIQLEEANNLILQEQRRNNPFFNL